MVPLTVLTMIGVSSDAKSNSVGVEFGGQAVTGEGRHDVSCASSEPTCMGNKKHQTRHFRALAEARLCRECAQLRNPA
jgi:hypothetical protein